MLGLDLWGSGTGIGIHRGERELDPWLFRTCVVTQFCRVMTSVQSWMEYWVIPDSPLLCLFMPGSRDAVSGDADSQAGVQSCGHSLAILFCLLYQKVSMCWGRGSWQARAPPSHTCQGKLPEAPVGTF